MTGTELNERIEVVHHSRYTTKKAIIEEMAEYLQIDSRTIWRWMRVDRIPRKYHQKLHLYFNKSQYYEQGGGDTLQVNGTEGLVSISHPYVPDNPDSSLLDIRHPLELIVKRQIMNVPALLQGREFQEVTSFSIPMQHEGKIVDILVNVSVRTRLKTEHEEKDITSSIDITSEDAATSA